jgi:hypothetical protein
VAQGNPDVEFVDFLLKLQDEVEPYHHKMEETLREARESVSSILTLLNDLSINEVTDGESQFNSNPKTII